MKNIQPEEDKITQLDISKILVNTKYKLDVESNCTAVYVVDIPKASKLIIDLINKQSCPVS